MQFMGDIRDMGALVVSICLWLEKAMKHEYAATKCWSPLVGCSKKSKIYLYRDLLPLIHLIRVMNHVTHMSHDPVLKINLLNLEDVLARKLWVKIV